MRLVFQHLLTTEDSGTKKIKSKYKCLAIQYLLSTEDSDKKSTQQFFFVFQHLLSTEDSGTKNQKQIYMFGNSIFAVYCRQRQKINPANMVLFFFF